MAKEKNPKTKTVPNGSQTGERTKSKATKKPKATRKTPIQELGLTTIVIVEASPAAVANVARDLRKEWPGANPVASFLDDDKEAKKSIDLMKLEMETASRNEATAEIAGLSLHVLRPICYL